MHNDQSQLDLARMCMVQGRERGRSRIRLLQDTIRPSRASDSRPGEIGPTAYTPPASENQDHDKSQAVTFQPAY
jgi:hypothetical protein